MSDTPKKKTTKKKTEATPKKERKPNSGQFKKGNTVGKETMFKKGHNVPCKFKEEYCDELIKFFTTIEPQVIYDEYYDKDGNLKSKRASMIIPPKLPMAEQVKSDVTYKFTLSDEIDEESN